MQHQFWLFFSFLDDFLGDNPRVCHVCKQRWKVTRKDNAFKVHFFGKN